MRQTVAAPIIHTSKLLLSRARHKSTVSCSLLRSHFHSHTATTVTAPPLAFVFDIDGVLIRGPNVLPAAKRALDILDGDNPFQRKIPYLLLTNGGGIGETERAQKLSKQLGRPASYRNIISPDHYLQAHTILKKYAHEYHDKPVLVLGGKLDVVRNVAKQYGYERAFTTLDVLAWNPAVWPLHTLSPQERTVAQPVDFSSTPISAIFVYHDPRNWALDVQVACDVIQSGGIVGGPPIALSSQTNPVKLVFCNPDLIWRSDFDRPRIGQGAFKVAFQAVFKALTGEEYPYVQYGKPTLETYNFAKQILQDQLQHMYHGQSQPPSVYMVGDNPESDIAGANAAQWHSVLVKTGVYDTANGPPTHPPTHFADDVEGAVEWAIRREYHKFRAGL
ncbi:HAD-like domain-containing protein [Panaeolus papilionaceus]|nr:HAD-like domain-containing protein [Panaeolus papilionaceus]